MSPAQYSLAQTEAQAEEKPWPPKGTPAYSLRVLEWHRQQKEEGCRRLEEMGTDPDAPKDTEPTSIEKSNAKEFYGIVVAVSDDGTMEIQGIRRDEGVTFHVQEWAYVPENPELLRALTLGRYVTCSVMYEAPTFIGGLCIVQMGISENKELLDLVRSYSGSIRFGLLDRLMDLGARAGCDQEDYLHINTLTSAKRFELAFDLRCEIYEKYLEKLNSE